MITRYLTSLLMVPVWVSASATVYFSSGPASKKFPADLTTENANGLIPYEQVYKHGYTADGWTVEAVDETSYSFVAPSFSGTSDAQDSWLTTAPFTVGKATSWIRWNAKSVLPGFPEDYDVVVTDTGSQEKVTVTSVVGEYSEWQTRAVSLADFEGKEITVSFVCKSINKYMLAVRNIFAGEFDTPEWIIDDRSPRYVAVSEGATAVGTITNMGADAKEATIVCRVGDLEMTSETRASWETTDTYEFSFDLPVSLDEATAYTIGISDKEGNFTPLTSSSVFASHFARNLVVDEGTGMWCNNCPDGILELDKLKSEYGEQIIELSCHVNDLLAMDDYWSNLKFYAVPYMMLNRNHDTAGSTSKNFKKEYEIPTIAGITMPLWVINVKNGIAEVTVTSRFAETLDNSDGRYRIGYTVTADIFSPETPEYYQANSLVYSKGKQYYILPSAIPCMLARFENAVIHEKFAFTGIEGSLPVNIEAGEDYSTSFTITFPEIAEKAEKLRVVAYILDTTTGTILNAASLLASTVNSIDCIPDGNGNNSVSLRVLPSGKCLIQGVSDDEIVTITVTDAAGRTTDKVKATKARIEEMVLNMPKGVAIISIMTSTGKAVVKAIG